MGRKFFWVKIIWVGNFFGSKNLGRKFVWVKKDLGKKKVGQKNLSKKKWVRNCFRSKKIGSEFFLGQTNFWVKKNVGNFFG